MAYRSSINVKNINKSLSGLNESLLRARESAKNIRTTIIGSTRSKRKSLSASIAAFKRRREAARRKEREDIVEASSVKGAISRSSSAVVNSTRGFLGRILDFLGTILVGWALTNLPAIIKMAQDLIKRMKKYFELLNNFRMGLQEFLISFGETVGGITAGLSRFDFLAIRRAADRGLKKMGDAFVKMNNSLDQVVRTLRQDIKVLLGLDKFDIPESGDDTTGDGGGGGDAAGGSAQLPDPKSAEMYRIAAALTTEGNSDQGYADILQVVANRVAHPGYGSNYTDVLAAGTPENPQFAGVWARPGGPNGLRSIQTLEQASKWSGQSENSLLEVIKLLSDPKRQASAAEFVGGALEFRAAPGYYLRNGLVPGEMGSDGRFYGSSWRGTSSDNQFLKDPSKDPMLDAPAPFTLPESQAPIQAPPAAIEPPPAQNVSASPTNKQSSNMLAMALQEGRRKPKTNTLVFNNKVVETRVISEPSSGGNTIVVAGGLNSSDRRNKYLSSIS